MNTTDIKIQLQLFSSSHLQAEKDCVFVSIWIHGEDTSITRIWLHKYLKDTDLIVWCLISIKEIPKMQQLKIKFKSKNIEKSGKVDRFCYSTIIRSTRCEETQFTSWYQSKLLWKYRCYSSFPGVHSIALLNWIYCLVTLLSYSQMWTRFDIHVLKLPLQSHTFFLDVKICIGTTLTLFITLYTYKHIYSEVVLFSYFSFISDCSHLGGHSPLWSSQFSWIMYI